MIRQFRVATAVVLFNLFLITLMLLEVSCSFLKTSIHATCDSCSPSSPMLYCHHHPHADKSTVCITRSQQHLAGPWQVTTAFSFVLTQPAAWPGTATHPPLVLSTWGHTVNIPFPPYKISFKMPAILAKMIKNPRDTCIGATSDLFFFCPVTMQPQVGILSQVTFTGTDSLHFPLEGSTDLSRCSVVHTQVRIYRRV